jgi:hypothetical protein
MSADAQDDKGYSEETCVRCGWRMGSPPVNCHNDDTPHRFPSQQRQDEEIERLRQDFEQVCESAGHWKELAQRFHGQKETAEGLGERLIDAEAKVQQLEDTLREIRMQATRHKRATDEQKYLITDLEIIEGDARAALGVDPDPLTDDEILKPKDYE